MTTREENRNVMRETCKGLITTIIIYIKWIEFNLFFLDLRFSEQLWVGEE